MVAFGTSAPELAVSLNAAMLGKDDIAIGNVISAVNVLAIEKTVVEVAEVTGFLRDRNLFGQASTE